MYYRVTLQDTFSAFELGLAELTCAARCIATIYNEINFA